MTVDHETDCAGFHTDAVTCAYATAMRREWAADPFHCHGESRMGYHWFASEDPDCVCRYHGCERTRGELTS